MQTPTPGQASQQVTQLLIISEQSVQASEAILQRKWQLMRCWFIVVGLAVISTARRSQVELRQTPQGSGNCGC